MTVCLALMFPSALRLLEPTGPEYPHIEDWAAAAPRSPGTATIDKEDDAEREIRSACPPGQSSSFA